MGVDMPYRGPGISIPRPTTLLLENVRKSLEEMKMDDMAENNLSSSQLSNGRRKKKRRAADAGVKKFEELYLPTGEDLGQGSFGSVKTYRNIITNREMAVKVIKLSHSKSRSKVLKEIEIFHLCKGQDNILQLVEFFEEEDQFYMVFEKMEGGTLLETIERRGSLTEQEASLVVRDIARALRFLHDKGIAHRDLKPENILCVKAGQLVPVKICDFDLGSGVVLSKDDSDSVITTPELQTPVGSAEFMAPEVVDVWQDQAWSYDKRCDLWSLGIIVYILLCGYPPFYGQCGRACGWERGEACPDCQTQLFECIQDGEFIFPTEDWHGMSDDAKDLIRHLIVRDPLERYCAQQVLDHPWVAMESPTVQLATPRVLLRNNSIKELDNFAENANAFNRLILRQHMSIDYERAAFTIGGLEEEEDGDGSDSDQAFLTSSSENDTMFQMDSDDEAPILWMGISPPGSSSLAQRRLQARASDKNGNEEPNQPAVVKPQYGRSPPKVLSAIF